MTSLLHFLANHGFAVSKTMSPLLSYTEKQHSMGCSTGWPLDFCQSWPLANGKLPTFIDVALQPAVFTETMRTRRASQSSEFT